MQVDCITTNEVDGEIEKFIVGSANGGMFHSPLFLSYHAASKFPQPEFELCHLLIRDEKGVVGFMPGMRVVSEGRNIYRSPLGSSYGGLVHKLGLYYEEIDAIYEAIIAFLDRYFDEIRVIPPSPVYASPDASIVNYQHFLLLKYGFQVVSADLLLCAPVSGRLDFMSTFHRKTRTELNQALRNNLAIEVSDVVTPDDYHLLFLSQSNFGTTPTHTLDELNVICSLRPGDVKVFRTLHQGRVIGGIICFKISDRVLNTFYIYDDKDFRHLKPNHFAYYHVLKYAGDHGFQYVDFGPSSAGYTDKKNLIFFKEKFGAHPYLRYSYVRQSFNE
jgi:hypothetical protein